MPKGRPDRERRSDVDRGPARAREPRGPDMVGGVWFTISLGRKQRADPKWLLPMICKAGGVTKRDVGSIRIDDTETRFEISAERAADFAEQLKRSGGGERGIVIAPAGEAHARPTKPKFKPAGQPAYARDHAGADRKHARKYKGGKPKRPA
jgi:ATP-dependent RNA helicase DeaD